MKPVIGITCDYDWDNRRIQLFSGYYEAILECGGIPFILPVTERPEIYAILSKIDGIMFTGGQDIDPYIFGEEPHTNISSVNPLRDQFEIELCRKATEYNLPALGICKGMQVMNVALGGDIYQDIASQIKDKQIICHNQKAPKWYGSHIVNIDTNSCLYEILKTGAIRVNSFHHQAVRKLGNSLASAGKSNDDIIEAIESKILRFYIGVQWHPEHMWQRDNTMLGIFQAFVSSCASR